MKRRLTAVMVMAMGCGTANGVPISPSDAGVDAGRSVADWQSYAIGQWATEAAAQVAEMQGVIDRGSPRDFDAAGVEMFRPAVQAYRAARPMIDADAGLAERRAMGVRYFVEVTAPAFCRAADAFRLAALGHPLMQPEPRVRCSELPVSDASRWWERWP
jgi:hypothetical protein